jgi:hypothetical protein
MGLHSIHLGVNVPDVRHYGSGVPALAGAHADAVAWYRVASDLLCCDTSELRVGEQATTEELRRWVTRTRALQPPQTVLVTWSGHGTQVARPAGDPDGESDSLDETWVMWDRMLLDDEVHELLACFPRGFRVVAVVDCCHSHGSFRDLPPLGPGPAALERVLDRSIALQVVEANAQVYADARASLPHPARSLVADFLGLAACQEHEVARELDSHGLFTKAVVDLVRTGFQGSYEDLVDAAAARTPGQLPRTFWEGSTCPLRHDPAFPQGS